MVPGSEPNVPVASVAGLDVLQITDGWAMGQVRDCVVIVWRSQPTSDAFRFRNEQLRALVGRAAGHCALIELVEPTSKPPSDETRRVAMDVFKQLGDQLTAVGFVIEGSEVRSTLARAILTGMMFFVKQLQPTKVFKRSVDVAEWVRGRVQASDPEFSRTIVSALEHLRARIGQR
jgi:hypothetical protein